MRFDGKTALVTGGARGIGLAISERLLSEGATVAILDRDPPRAALAREVATRGILVHAVAPAVIGTELLQQMTKDTVDMLVAKIPMGRVGTPAEVATLVAWLASDECTFTTGAVHDLSGGRATY